MHKLLVIIIGLIAVAATLRAQWPCGPAFIDEPSAWIVKTCLHDPTIDSITIFERIPSICTCQFHGHLFLQPDEPDNGCMIRRASVRRTADSIVIHEWFTVNQDMEHTVSPRELIHYYDRSGRLLAEGYGPQFAYAGRDAFRGTEYRYDALGQAVMTIARSDLNTSGCTIRWFGRRDSVREEATYDYRGVCTHRRVVNESPDGSTWTEQQYDDGVLTRTYRRIRSPGSMVDTLWADFLNPYTHATNSILLMTDSTMLDRDGRRIGHVESEAGGSRTRRYDSSGNLIERRYHSAVGINGGFTMSDTFTYAGGDVVRADWHDMNGQHLMQSYGHDATGRRTTVETRDSTGRVTSHLDIMYQLNR